VAGINHGRDLDARDIFMRVSISNNLGVVETTYCTVLTESDAIEPPMLLDRLSAHLSASRTSTGRVKYIRLSSAGDVYSSTVLLQVQSDLDCRLIPPSPDRDTWSDSRTTRRKHDH
jgi:hypothetical protein